DRPDLGVRFGGGGVDRDEPGVGVGAAQDRPVEHSRQLDVVDVVAASADEAGVLLARHPAETVVPVAGLPVGVLPVGVLPVLAHGVTSSALSAGFSAAQRTERTMFS